MRTIRRLPVLLALVVLPLTTSSTVAAAPTWAPATTATIHPGVQTDTAGGQCTANFVFYDTTNVYIGQAAHCSGTEGNLATNGCTSESLPVGTPVTVSGASRPGKLVYNSWVTMQGLGESDPDTCEFNDFALVKLDPADASRVNPSVPHWGGPVGINTSGTTLGETVYSYGNSSLRLGLTLLSPKTGVSLGDEGGDWSHQVSTLTPGVPGDSGSAFLDSRGRALGVLSTLRVGLPYGLWNGVSDLGRALDYLRSHTAFTGVQLALGTVAFDGSKLPLGL